MLSQPAAASPQGAPLKRWRANVLEQLVRGRGAAWIVSGIRRFIEGLQVSGLGFREFVGFVGFYGDFRVFEGFWGALEG